jgi:ATP-dependent Lon protease
MEEALTAAREGALQASATYEQVQAAIRLRVLRPGDASLAEATAALQSARQRLQAVQHQLKQALAAIEMRQSMRSMYRHALVQAKREAYLREHKPELLERLAEIETDRASDRRLGGPDWGDHIRAKSEHEQARARVQRQIDTILAEAGI